MTKIRHRNFSPLLTFKKLIKTLKQGIKPKSTVSAQFMIFFFQKLPLSPFCPPILLVTAYEEFWDWNIMLNVWFFSLSHPIAIVMPKLRRYGKQLSLLETSDVSDPFTRLKWTKWRRYLTLKQWGQMSLSSTITTEKRTKHELNSTSPKQRTEDFLKAWVSSGKGTESP